LIVPPTGGSATPLWERRYEPTIRRPNFFPQLDPWELASTAPQPTAESTA
jgi:nitric-oxide synthase, bacterial